MIVKAMCLVGLNTYGKSPVTFKIRQRVNITTKGSKFSLRLNIGEISRSTLLIKEKVNKFCFDLIIQKALGRGRVSSRIILQFVRASPFLSNARNK